MNKNLGNSC